MRITGGEAAGRRFQAPGGHRVRPTGAKVRQALFNTLAARVQGARWLDLYGGAGSLSFEAASRGALAFVVEQNSQAREQIRRNLVRLAMADRVELLPVRAERAVSDLRERGLRFDVIVCDPPWKTGLSPSVREGLQHLVAEDGWVVLESSAKASPVDLPGLAVAKVKRYGDTVLYYYQLRRKREEESDAGGDLSRNL